jgi:hypothetical protein
MMLVLKSLMLLFSFVVSTSRATSPRVRSLVVGCLETVSEAAAQDQKTSISAGIEWIWHARTGLPTKAVRLVMVASAVAVE